jgi:hypothetical protein
MRHFLLLGPIPTLPLGMPMTAGQTALVTLSGFPYAALSRGLRTGAVAVAIAAITIAAYHHGRTAAHAQVASSRIFHWRSGPMGIDDNVRFVKYSACNVACWLRARRGL